MGILASLRSKFNLNAGVYSRADGERKLPRPSSGLRPRWEFGFWDSRPLSNFYVYSSEICFSLRAVARSGILFIGETINFRILEGGWRERDILITPFCFLYDFFVWCKLNILDAKEQYFQMGIWKF